jgi:predicted PurR-regulated permease PerM
LYYRLTIQKKWSKGLTALLFILTSIVIISIPVYFSIRLISPKINSLINNQHEVIQGLEIFSKKIEVYIGQELFTSANAEKFAKNISSYIPSFLNSTANILTNLIMMFLTVLSFIQWKGDRKIPKQDYPFKAGKCGQVGCGNRFND